MNIFNKEAKRARAATAGAGSADTTMKPGIKNSKTKPKVGSQNLGAENLKTPKKVKEIK